MSSTIAEPVYWSVSKKAGFRFALIFFLAYLSNFIELFANSIPWFGKNILHLAQPIVAYRNGSGDTTYNYVTLLIVFILSLVAAIIWTIIDRKPRNYNKLYYWLTVVIRYYLAIMMLNYGFAKLNNMQFGSPSLDRLLEPYGNSSPMGLAWTYYGYSNGFKNFVGLAEIACGLLLLFRRTYILGALLGVVVSANIMAVNYFFDVPVKLLSTLLLVMSIFLLLRDAERLINIFFLNKTALPANLEPHRFKKRWVNITLMVAKYLIIIYVLAQNISVFISPPTQFSYKPEKTPLYGIYKVETFVRNNDTIAPLTTDTSRWSQLIISYINGARIKLMNDSSKYVAFKVDTLAQKIVINTYTDTLDKYRFTYTKPQPGTLLLKGKWQQDSLKIKFTRFDEKQFLLINRGFHWINERPLNR